jgi:hypothetical protein
MRDFLITDLPINNNFSTTQIVENIYQTLHCDIGTVAKLAYSILRNKTASSRNYHHIIVTFVRKDAPETFLKRKKTMDQYYGNNYYQFLC